MYHARGLVFPGCPFGVKSADVTWPISNRERIVCIISYSASCYSYDGYVVVVHQQCNCLLLGVGGGGGVISRVC